MKNKEQKMKRCPICNSEAVAYYIAGHGYFVSCLNEKCIMYNLNIMFESKEEAINAWNKRGGKSNILSELLKNYDINNIGILIMMSGVALLILAFSIFIIACTFLLVF